MKISKTSWHYRLARWSTPEKQLVNGELKPMSLCHYVIDLTFVIVHLPMLGLMAVLLSPLLLVDWAQKKWPAKGPQPPKEPKTLLGKWLKANKDKVCPLIEWE